MKAIVQFTNKNDKEFFATLRKRVDGYFQEKNISKHANTQMVIKVIVLLGTLWGSWAALVFADLHWAIMLGLALLIGFTSALIGLNICHDAIHGSLSGNSTINKVMGYLFNVVGANMYVWSITHNKLHHTYTNIPGIDEDVDAVPGVRTSPELKRRAIHRFQHIYAFILYGLATISWVFLKDYKKMFQKDIGGIPRSEHPMKEYFVLFVFKMVYYAIFLVTPLLMIDLPWYWILVGFALSHWVEGFTLAMVFQMAHIVEGPHFPSQPKEGESLEESWARHQLYTTANFARKRWLAFWLFGGLNFQIEHHLFPTISHIHFREISTIVRATAIEYGLPYFEYPSFWSAIKSHFRTLKVFGSVDNVEPVFKKYREQFMLQQEELRKAS